MALAGRHDGKAGEESADQKIASSEELALVDTVPSQPPEGTASQHDNSLSQHSHVSTATLCSCDGPGIALIFGKFVDMYQELRSLDTDTAKLTASCCNFGRIFVLRA